MADELLVVAGFHDGCELYKKVIPKPETYEALLQVNTDFAKQSLTLQNLLQRNPQLQLILNKIQQKFKFADIETFVDLPTPDICYDDKFKPEYQVEFLVGVRP